MPQIVKHMKIKDQKEHNESNIKVVILGSGFAGVNVYQYLHKLVHGLGVSFYMISDVNYFQFTPLLHEVASGLLRPEDIISPIRENINCCVGDFILDKVVSIDVDAKIVKLEHSSINFDYLVIATGASTNYRGIEGAKEYSYPLKTVDEATELKDKVISLFEEREEGSSNREISIIVVGGGPTGIEVATEVSDLTDSLVPLYRSVKKENIKISIFNATENFLNGFPDVLKRSVKHALERGRISLRLDAAVQKVENGTLVLKSGESVHFDLLIWTGGVSPNTPKMNLPGFDITKRITVSQYLNLEGHECIFAIGDVSDIEDNPVPQLAQVAIDESKVCAYNILQSIEKKPLVKYRKNLKGFLLSLGRFNAASEVGSILFLGFPAWILWKFFYLSMMFGKGSKIKIVFDWFFDAFESRDLTKIDRNNK